MEKDVCTWCDFNGKWLKDLNFFFMCCTFILLTSVEGRTIEDV